MDPTCGTVVAAPDGAPVRVSVWAPAGVADEPGTPFGVAYEPAPVVLAGVAAEQAVRLVPVLLEDGRSVVLASAPELSAAGVLQAMSRLGVTQAHVVGPLAGAVSAQAPARALSATMPAAPAAETAAAELLATIHAAEPTRRHRPLVTVDAAGAHVAPGPADVVVRHAVPEDEPAIQTT